MAGHRIKTEHDPGSRGESQMTVVFGGRRGVGRRGVLNIQETSTNWETQEADMTLLSTLQEVRLQDKLYSHLILVQ